ncbi:MAG: histidine kinase [Melioribacteraceae bacterium]|nr:histidine kinase [Melioribacteraceae bacterium]MCF8265623.1 histidine kinase [Melioribacteraceae bacterium]MCF8411879.1 histidine kinase [Melioribacteraceae bacterium]
MSIRIRDILLVSSLYDSYVFEEDGRLYELIREEYHFLNLSHSPELVQVSSGEEAIRKLKEEDRYDLVITTLHVDDMSAVTFARKLKDNNINRPVILLGYDNKDLLDLLRQPDAELFEKVFIWQGDFRIILGIVKYLEDRLNIERDINNVGVQVIILIEDSVRFYSSYLPIVYTEVLRQAQSLIEEGINLSHKFLRMRARPKILLCSTYEEAVYYFTKYEDYILGIISDINFPRKGKNDPHAGIKFAKMAKSRHTDIPVLLQSNVNENEELAYSVGASFLLKDSPTLLQDLRSFMKDNFSFGPFIFRTPKGKEVAKANNLLEFENQLVNIPVESLVFHASRNHFSNWLKARTEFWLAHILRPKKVTDFETAEGLRGHILDSIREFRKSRAQGIISDFNKEYFDPEISFARLGGGSIGGKARGLGFVNKLLSDFNVRRKFEGANIFIPTSVVVGAEVFDQFLDDNRLRDFALRSDNDNELLYRFTHANAFPFEIKRSLVGFLDLVREPIAVRSSSLLEDSQGQPFAGVYDTFMLPNNHPDIEVRLEQLITMIKRIYASIFFRKAKDYIGVTSYRLEEEKMAVIIQKVVGAEHDGKYYPEICGVAKSYNFYPAPPLKSDDGIVSAAFGLGKTIAEGGKSIRFCPRHPHHMLQFATINDTLNHSPQKFFAIDLSRGYDAMMPTEEDYLNEHFLREAESDGTLYQVGSTYSHDNKVIYDGISRDGIRLFTMGPLLKYHTFPLPEIIETLLEIGSWGMGSPVEIEFAVNLSVPKNEPKEFALLQMRPLVINNEQDELDIDGHEKSELICESSNVLGNGIINDLFDIVYVNRETFERSQSKEVAREVGQINSKLVSDGKRYLLIGVGRWGTLDPWLGIPVTWDQISGAKAIIEGNFKDFDVTPSQGSHFFQNLTSFKVGYFTVDDHKKDAFVDWDWLNNLPVFEQKNHIKHVRLDKPLSVKINGQEGRGIILKP